MKTRHIITVGCIMALAAGSAFAGIGAGRGLPISWDITNTRGYGTITGIAANPGSAMCVECHAVNPSDKIPAPAALAGIPVAEIAVDYGSHYVQNQLGTPAAVNTEALMIGASNSGGGFPGGFAGTRNGGEYENTTGTWSSGGFSRYQDKASATLATTNAAGGMICESCHSVLVNLGDQLLLDAYVDNGAADICTGCHVTMHTNGNLMAFDGASRKRHHILTGDSLIDDATHYKGGGTASLMWAPLASDRLDLGWCGAPYTPIAAPTWQLDIIAGAPIAFRNACNVGGAGTRLFSAVTGDVVVPDATTIDCTNCHRPHNAQATGGAFILRGGVTSPADPAYNGQQGTSRAAPGETVAFGIRRQNDVGNHGSLKVYGEYLPLCVSCHQGYGQ